MNSEFVFYPTTLDQIPHSIRVDIHVHEAFDTHPHGVIITVPYKGKEDGYPSTEEFERLNRLEDSFLEQLSDKGALLMGIITGNQSLDIFFASKDADTIRDVLSRVEADPYEILVHPSGAESLYVQYLYPNVYEQQYIANQDYCKQLLDKGDRFETPRDVVFFASFHDNQSAHAFTHEFENMTKEAHIHMAQDGHFHVHLTMNLIPDVMTMNMMTDRIINETEKGHGHFEGWQTTVLAPSAATN